jgi:hypothetical protein
MRLHRFRVGDRDDVDQPETAATLLNQSVDPSTRLEDLGLWRASQLSFRMPDTTMHVHTAVLGVNQCLDGDGIGHEVRVRDVDRLAGTDDRQVIHRLSVLRWIRPVAVGVSEWTTTVVRKCTPLPETGCTVSDFV